jgi:glycerophosphoryl diester phosphodiesterase
VGGAPENSLAAFEAACAAGYGVELDVRLTADGDAVVFHDEGLDRMTVQSGLVEEHTADSLTALALLGGDHQHIPTLAEALATIHGRGLVLVELKTPAGREGPLEKRVGALLSDYTGPAAVLSFNADALARMAFSAPNIARGLNAECVDDLERRSEANAQFLSVELSLLDSAKVQSWRAAGGVAVTWTVRSIKARERAEALADNLLFEGAAL